MRAARTDANHAAVVKALRQCGCSVFDTSAVGGGFPDLVVGCAGKTMLMEVKDGAKPPSARRLTPAQLELHAHWRGGPIAVVLDVESAIRAARTMG